MENRSDKLFDFFVFLCKNKSNLEIDCFFVYNNSKRNKRAISFRLRSPAILYRYGGQAAGLLAML